MIEALGLITRLADLQKHRLIISLKTIIGRARLCLRARNTRVRVLALGAAALSLSLAVPLVAVAGFLSSGWSVSNVFGAKNSQTVPLLEAVQSPMDPKALGGGGITIVSDSALLPEAGPAGTLVDIDGASGRSHGEINVYVVREGDTLSEIADMFGVSVNTVRWANNITRDKGIRPGDALVILPVTGVQHTVQKGDTLESLAKKYGGDVTEIRIFNDLEGADLEIGMAVTVPGGELPKPKSAPVPRPPIAGEPPGGSVVGYFMRPIQGGVKSQGLHGYNGVDLATYYGAPIYAAAAGEVIVSREGGWNGGYGNYVVVRHANGTQTLYAHNSDNIVSVGETVFQGQTIGYIGSSGRSTGSHVHFEVRGAANPF